MKSKDDPDGDKVELKVLEVKDTANERVSILIVVW